MTDGGGQPGAVTVSLVAAIDSTEEPNYHQQL